MRRSVLLSFHSSHLKFLLTGSAPCTSTLDKPDLKIDLSDLGNSCSCHLRVMLQSASPIIKAKHNRRTMWSSSVFVCFSKVTKDSVQHLWRQVRSSRSWRGSHARKGRRRFGEGHVGRFGELTVGHFRRGPGEFVGLSFARRVSHSARSLTRFLTSVVGRPDRLRVSSQLPLHS